MGNQERVSFMLLCLHGIPMPTTVLDQEDRRALAALFHAPEVKSAILSGGTIGLPPENVEAALQAFNAYMEERH